MLQQELTRAGLHPHHAWTDPAGDYDFGNTGGQAVALDDFDFGSYQN